MIWSWLIRNVDFVSVFFFNVLVGPKACGAVSRFGEIDFVGRSLLGHGLTVSTFRPFIELNYVITLSVDLCLGLHTLAST